jgi:DNA uptake protein ComE-like DNA-binding protein
MFARLVRSLFCGSGSAGSGRVIGVSLALAVALSPPAATAQTFGSAEAFLKVLGLGAMAGRPAATAERARLDLNHATMRQLATIPGIDYAKARKIIIERPYAAIQELTRTGLTAAAIERIAPFVTVATGAATKP